MMLAVELSRLDPEPGSNLAFRAIIFDIDKEPPYYKHVEAIIEGGSSQFVTHAAFHYIDEVNNGQKERLHGVCPIPAETEKKS